jgi:MFS family permease
MNPSLTAEQRLQENLRHLNYDILGFGILTGSTIAFIAVYASRLGATPFQIGLLTAGPAAVNLLLSIPIGKWLEGKGLIRTSWISALLQRLPYFLLVPLPLLFFPELQLWLIILITLLMSIPGTVLTIAFNAMFADVIPPDRRAEAVGRRNAIVAISISAATLLSGLLLDQIDYPYNYQLVYAIGALGALFSTYHLTLVKHPDGQTEKSLMVPVISPKRIWAGSK